MKNSLLFAITILAVGCGGKDESTTETKPVEEKVLEVKEEVKAKESVAEAKPESKSVSTDEMEIREGIGYVRGSDVPYTGKVFKLYESGQKELELNVKDGKYDGLVVWWHQNGQKSSEVKYKDNRRIQGSEKYWNSKGEPVNSREEAESEK